MFQPLQLSLVAIVTHHLHFQTKLKASFDSSVGKQFVKSALKGWFIS